MKNKVLSLLLLLTLAVSPALAQDFVNLTPKAKSMQVGSGQLVLPAVFAVSVEGLPEEMAAEVQKFVSAYNAATGSEATVSNTAA